MEMGLTGENPIVFKYETCPLLENFPAHYAMPKKEKTIDRLGSKMDKVEDEIRAINPASYTVIDYTALPSSVSILNATGANNEDI
jgi:hypothetical protein